MKIHALTTGTVSVKQLRAGDGAIGIRAQPLESQGQGIGRGTRIGIEQQEKFTGGVFCGQINRAGKAKIPFGADELDLRKFARQHFRRAVGRTVVHHENFPGHCAVPGQHGAHGFARQPAGVAGDDDDGNIRT